MAMTATSTGENFWRLLGGLPAVLHNKCLMLPLSAQMKAKSNNQHILRSRIRHLRSKARTQTLVEGKLKLSLYTSWWCVVGSECTTPRILNSSLEASSQLQTPAAVPKIRAFSTHRKGGGWIDPRACLNVPVKRSTSCFWRYSDLKLFRALPTPNPLQEWIEKPVP